MDQGRVSNTSIILMSLLCILVFHSNMSFAAEYIVGDGKGWSFHVQNWTLGKTFKEGDILGKDLYLIKVSFT
ncbi:putative cupredoxin [Medicago truncatula]|uniref:Putative cupredoxin n=1 Tax=Medicago truncatula TaxID=3880 RepID=A0A396J6B1_MEDTR|nr:putative cupredoxin [Medicago truncatula]